jgi:hypothetical protein
LDVVGKCFYYQTPPQGEHPFVVLAPSSERGGHFICVNITEKREFSDTSCELARGLHCILKKPVSVVNFAMARDLPRALIERLTREQGFPDFSPDLLLRIQEAAIAEGSRLPFKFKEAIATQIRSGSPA